MPAGDAQRVWFAEMVEVLRSEWKLLSTWDERIALRGRLEAMLHQIRRKRGIQPPMMRCWQCGQRHRSAAPRVSVRAMILSLGRFGLLSTEEKKEVEKQWKKHRQEHGLTLYGQVEDEVPLKIDSPEGTPQPELRVGNPGMNLE
jgi:hypothetical protein